MNKIKQLEILIEAARILECEPIAQECELAIDDCLEDMKSNMMQYLSQKSRGGVHAEPDYQFASMGYSKKANQDSLHYILEDISIVFDKRQETVQFVFHTPDSPMPLPVDADDIRATLAKMEELGWAEGTYECKGDR